MGNRYLDEFLSLKCAGDVLNVCSPIARAEKEISEAMAVIWIRCESKEETGWHTTRANT